MVGAAPYDRNARAATATLFAINGALFANLLPRYPEIKADLAMSNTVLGLTVAAFPAGALLCGPVAGVLIRRFGSARVAVYTGVLLGVFLLAAALAPVPALLAAALLAAGGADAITDVAQNAQGLAVQRRYGRSIINSLHATWSVGAVTGGLMGALAVAAGIPRGAQLGIAAAAFGALCLLMLPLLLPAEQDGTERVVTGEAGGAAGSGTRLRASRLLLVVLAVIAVAGAAVEDIGSSWAAVYLHDVLVVPEATAAFGYIALVGGQFVGRVLGDRMVDRFGEANVVRAGGLLAAAGMGAALAFPGVPGTIAGFGAAGFGVAAVIPAAFHRADELSGLRAGTGLTVVSWTMRLGFMCGPPAVGMIADAVGLRFGLLVVPIAGLAIALCAPVLAPRRRLKSAPTMEPPQ